MAQAVPPQGPSSSGGAELVGTSSVRAPIGAGEAMETDAATVVQALKSIDIVLVALDQFGVSHPSEDGTVVLSYSSDAYGRVPVSSSESDLPNGADGFRQIGYVSVAGVEGGYLTAEVIPVHAGRATVRVPQICYVRFLDVRLGGRTASIRTPRDWVQTPAEGELRVAAHWPDVITLQVRDGTSGSDLNHVDVVVPVPAAPWTLAHPGAASGLRTLIEASRSPLSIPPDVFEDYENHGVTIYVGAPGHAYQCLVVDPSIGGERQVMLQNGGDLEVFVDGAASELNTMIRVRTGNSGGGNVIAETPLRDQRHVLFESLEVGHYWVRAEIGKEWFREPEVLGSAEVDVVSGVLSSTRVALTPLAPLELVPFRGAVYLPAAWGVDEVTIDGELAGHARGGGDGKIRESLRRDLTVASDVWTFDAGLVQPGRYHIEVGPVYFNVVVAVPRSGSNDTRIDVPPPATIDVQVIDAETDQVVSPRNVQLWWNCDNASEWSRSWLPPVAKWSPRTQSHEIVAPAGPVLVTGRAEGYVEVNQVLSAASESRNHVVLRLAPASRVVLSLRDGGSVVPWSHPMRARAVPLDGQPQPRLSSQHPLAFFDSCGIGRYRLEIEPIVGYRPIPDREIVVQRGKTTVVEIALEPR